MASIGIGVVTLLIVLTVSMVITRVGAVALTICGASPEVARFQARSAFTGVGFTTSESDALVRDPSRRGIIMTLMILGNLGVITMLGSVVLSFGNVEGAREGGVRLGILVAGLMVLFLAAQSKTLERWMTRGATWALSSWAGKEFHDLRPLLRVHGDHAVVELHVGDGHPLQGADLGRLAWDDRGVQVLGHWRGGAFERKARTAQAGDTLILYGSDDALRDLDLTGWDDEE